MQSVYVLLTISYRTQMEVSPTSQRKIKLNTILWVTTLILMVASATHLLRSALKSNETIAIAVALSVFVLCLILSMGSPNKGPRQRRYIPWSAIPILLLAIWAANARLFGRFDVSAVLFHLDHSLAYDGVRDDIVEFIAFLIFAVILIFCISLLARRDKRMVVIERVAAAGLLFFNPISTYAYDSLLNPNRNAFHLETSYQPVVIKSADTSAKNLLLIYLESMEATYAKPAFGDVYDDLNTLSADAFRINGVTQIQDTGWTMAGLVASQCGIPLLSYGLIMKNRMKNIESFLPNADCLAVRLSEQGYQTRFYGGASLKFAGKGKFLTSHGYQYAYGLDEIPQEKRGEVSHWGLYDDRLYELALEELSALAKSETPYLLSILTLGAHSPAGYPAQVCYDMFADAADIDSTLLSVKCTARLTTDFLKAARKQGYLDDTVVVVMSDHLSHKNTQTRQLNQYDRENIFLIQSADMGVGEITRQASMMDIYPTILDSLGLLSASENAALGVSLFSDEPTLLETHGENALNLAIRSDKTLRKSLWGLNAEGESP